MSYFVVALYALKGVVSPVITSLSAPADWVVIGVVNRKAQFAENVVEKFLVMQVM